MLRLRPITYSYMDMVRSRVRGLSSFACILLQHFACLSHVLLSSFCQLYLNVATIYAGYTSTHPNPPPRAVEGPPRPTVRYLLASPACPDNRCKRLLIKSYFTKRKYGNLAQ